MQERRRWLPPHAPTPASFVGPGRSFGRRRHLSCVANLLMQFLLATKLLIMPKFYGTKTTDESSLDKPRHRQYIDENFVHILLKKKNIRSTGFHPKGAGTIYVCIWCCWRGMLLFGQSLTHSRNYVFVFVALCLSRKGFIPSFNCYFIIIFFFTILPFLLSNSSGKDPFPSFTWLAF